MVVQKTIDNLKDRPHDERKVVAGGVAITVVVVLLAAWAFMFVKRIQSGQQQINLDSGAQDEFNFSATKKAQQEIQAQQQASGQEDLSNLRYDAAGNQIQQGTTMQQSGSGPDQFGNTSNF